MNAREHVANGRASTARLRELVERLAGREIRVDDDWTASALLTHIAFWDRVAAARWRRRLEGGGEYPGLDPSQLDLLNAAGLPVWRALPPKTAGAEAIAAATAFDDLVDAQPDARIAEVGALSMSFIDRSQHRNRHLDAIERALG